MTNSKDLNNPIRLQIGSEAVQKALSVLQKYKQGKTNLEKRIVENEQWWKLQHWSVVQNKSAKDPEPTSAWLFNTIANKHADAMDNYPQVCVLPREKSDSAAAETLSSVLPVILEYNEFEKTYSDAWWYKLKTGTACYGIFWNKLFENGIGDVDIKQIDILNLFWEPGIKDIQDSRNVFTVELESNEVLMERYPFLKEKIGGTAIDVAQYIYDDTVDTDNKSAVVDWYYKKTVGYREIVHYCKFVNDTVIYASENDPLLFERGFYDHGKYPFVMDVLFAEEGTPCGFGYVDVLKNTQMYIDKLNQIIIKNALQSGRRRFFISDNAGINEEEFADWTKEFVHTSGNLDERNIREINISQLDGSVINLMYQKIEELKETSGTRDVSQGGTAAGVTAASAIAALQEAGSKLSRDMVKASYRAFKKINCMIIELIRQFYDEPRCFRISGVANRIEFSGFSNADIKETFVYDDDGQTLVSVHKPIFDLDVSCQKENPFSTSAQNELAKELYNLGMFNPQMANQALICLDMMNFEGKEKIVEKIRENASNYEQSQVVSLPGNSANGSEDDNYAVRAYRQNLPGRQTLRQASGRTLK